MTSWKPLLCLSGILLAHATSVSGQSAIDLDDGALLTRVRTEIDATASAGEKARGEREAFDETIASLTEAREGAGAALPADPGAMPGLAGLDEATLLAEVQAREGYLSAYRLRKQYIERIPILTDTRRKLLKQAKAAVRLAEQRAGDLRPLLTELARRVSAGRIARNQAVFADEDVDAWREAVARQQRESTAWLETYGTERELPPSERPTEVAEKVWDIETDRRLQHSLDEASVMLQSAKHEATERAELEKSEPAALPTTITRIHDEWRRALEEYDRAQKSVVAKRATLAKLDTDRRDLALPSKESIAEGEGHSELRSARREAALSDQMVGYDERRLELLRQSEEHAKELQKEVLALPTAFARARRQTVTLKAALTLAEDWRRDGKIESFDSPEGANRGGLTTRLQTLAATEAARRREVEELKERIDNKGLLESARKELEQEQQKNRRLHNALQEELSYAAFLKEMAAKDEATLIALVEPDGTLDASIEKRRAAVGRARRDFDRALDSLRTVRAAIRSVENPYVRIGFRRAPERLAEVKTELDALKDGRLPEDRSANPLRPAEDRAQPKSVVNLIDPPRSTDQSLLEDVTQMQAELEAQQDSATAQWQYFESLNEKLERYGEAVNALEGAFTSASEAWSSLINEGKRKYACALEIERRLRDGRIDPTQLSFSLAVAMTRKAVVQFQSDRDEEARRYARLNKYHTGERDRLQAIAAFGKWAEIRADAADARAALILQPVQRIGTATLVLKDIEEVDRKQLEYDAKNRRRAEDVGWETLLAALSRVKKRELFDDSLDTYYRAVTLIDRQVSEYDKGLIAYQELIESCTQERGQMVDAPEQLAERMKLRVFGYQSTRHLAAIAGSPNAQLSIEDVFKETYGVPLVIPEQQHDWDRDYWADRLFASEARLWGHRAWSDATRRLLSKLGLDAEIAQYDQHKARIENKIGALKARRQDMHASIAVIRADYSREINRAAVRTLISLLLIPILAWLIVRLVNRFARRIEGRAVEGLARERVAYHERMKTLSSVSRKTVTIVVWIIAGLYLLHEIGTPVSTLVASAGVLGLAFAFGAQSLIRDFFYGFFILLENQYTIGDWIQVGSISGTVERLTLRVTVLRDMEGTLHFVPNGTVTAVSNMTHGWSQVKMEIGVGYSEDIDRVNAVILAVANEVCQRPEWQSKVLSDPVVPGLESFGDSSLNIRLVVKTQPGAQWGLSRALRKRIKERFDEEGIEIPFPQRVIHHVHSESAEATGGAAHKEPV